MSGRHCFRMPPLTAASDSAISTGQRVLYKDCLPLDWPCTTPTSRSMGPGIGDAPTRWVSSVNRFLADVAVVAAMVPSSVNCTPTTGVVPGGPCATGLTVCATGVALPKEAG
jgi:hypothetical protein